MSGLAPCFFLHSHSPRTNYW